MKTVLDLTNKINKKSSYKIGIITDIHGNDKALIEVLKCLNDCDYILCLGDLIGIGPNSKEVLDIVCTLKNFYTVLGNHERYYLYGFNNPLSCLTFDHQEFTEKSIGDEYREYISNIPKEIRFSWNNQTFCLLHYERRKYRSRRFKIIERQPSLEKLIDLFEYHDQNYILYGHEHLKSLFENENRHFINPGSCGCPHPNKDELRYGILYLDEDIRFEFKTKQYDSSSVVKAMIDKDMPNKDLIIKDFYLL